jgi:SAM-dependent methyltransferase
MKRPNDNCATLIFPAVNQAALEYLKAARQRGDPVVCAASVANDEISAEWGGLHRLPSIYDDDFAQRFLSLVSEQAIDRLYCPVASVHDFMRRFIAASNLNIELIGQSPIRQQVEQHRQLMARARRLLPLVELCADGAPSLSLLEVAGVLRQATLIYGESNDDKLAAMMGFFASTPPTGDVVEIGSLMGRSAFVLLYLAWRYRIGPVLTIDPWKPDVAIQRESSSEFQSLVDEWDFDVLSEGFMVNMVPLRADDHAHIRLTSENAFKAYTSGEAILSSIGDRVVYSGKIAVIHIDGNHDYDCVKKDCELWLGRMLPGAWLILDDYIWAHGDGPFRAGNELLHDQPDRVERAFVCGKALFVKLRY